ncbi:uncharacterized protein LOC114351978 [Ostrinia furnacalis]|uniref:uncharacterized protein LOC114351978 n=1 Tax=Ostrinia furnacalis TaxID=93504 RepID=UPI00103D2382|nr:uncharacterized protein LOC114351978 [Ostrinia furnacalis]
MENKKHVFTPVEKRVFRDIVKTYLTIVENKGTDAASARTKNEAWIRVAAEFNSHPSITYNKVTSKQLRRLWANLKQRQKEFTRRITNPDPLSDQGEQDLYAPIIIKSTPSFNTDTAKSENSSDFSLPSHHRHTPETNCQGQSTTPIPIIPKLLSFGSIPNGNSDDEDKDRERRDRLRRVNEIHDMEMQILRERLREAKAKADLAELVLTKHKNDGGQPPTRTDYEGKRQELNVDFSPNE